jgi:type IV pilus assembly protein PilW
MMKSINSSQKGFSLIELLVAMAIASILMAGIYTFYQNQLKTHITQQQMVDMQQDARAAMYMMTRDIRMAG